MTQDMVHTFNEYTLAQCKGSEAMMGTIKRNILHYAALFHNFFQQLTDRPRVEIEVYEIALLVWSVMPDYLPRNIQQFHLERYFCFVPFGQYPFFTIYFHDVIIGQFLDSAINKIFEDNAKTRKEGRKELEALRGNEIEYYYTDNPADAQKAIDEYKYIIDDGYAFLKIRFKVCKVRQNKCEIKNNGIFLASLQLLLHST